VLRFKGLAFWQCWGLNSGHCICWVGALRFSLPQLFTFNLFFRWGLTTLLQLATDLSPPISTTPVAGITGVHHRTWLLTFKITSVGSQYSFSSNYDVLRFSSSHLTSFSSQARFGNHLVCWSNGSDI
jgi:hypothetical protein